MSGFVASLAFHVNVVPPFPRLRSSLLLSHCCCCHHCSHCCHCCCCCQGCWRCCHHCHPCHCCLRHCRQVIVRCIHCCHRHPSRLPLNHRSLLLLPCNHPLPPPLMSTAPAITVLHCPRIMPTPAIATHCHRCRMPSLPMSSCRCHQMPSNTVTAIKQLCSLPLLSITTVKCRRQLHHCQCAIVAVIHCCCPMSSLLWTPTTIKRWHPQLQHEGMRCSQWSSYPNFIVIICKWHCSGTTCCMHHCHWSWWPPICANPPLSSMATSSPCWLLNIFLSTSAPLLLPPSPPSPSIYPPHLSWCKL